jgi:lactobin A/cerein 7B family class IIb bacteriocin
MARTLPAYLVFAGATMQQCCPCFFKGVLLTNVLLMYREKTMTELTDYEIQQVNGGFAPLAIIAVDLALHAAFFGYMSFMTSDYMTGNDS